MSPDHTAVPRQIRCTFFVLKIFPLFEVLFFLAPFDWSMAEGDDWRADGVTEDLAVTESDLALSERGHFGVVRDHNDGVALAVKVAKKLGDDGLVGSVEVASGFVSEEDRWVVDEGARDADALLFAAR
jgi:hypothetical protein